MKYLFVLLLAATIATGANIPKTFAKAKEMSVRLYYAYHMKSFYTESELKPVVRITTKKFPYKPILTLQLGLVKSPYKGTKYVSRGQRIEWEHIVPVRWFTTVNAEIYNAWYNGHDKCVTSSGTTYKGRKCAAKVSPLFNRMESDMYNLVPVIGALNALRSDKLFGIIDGEVREFGETIDMEITSSTVEVMPSKRGNVARIMLYMNAKYGVKFPDHNNTLIMLKEWNLSDPEDEWERQKKQILHSTFGMEF